MLDLDKILVDPYEVKINKKKYLIDDPGIDLMLRLVRANEQLQKGELEMEEFFGLVRSAVPKIPDKVFNSLSINQVVMMFNGIGEHFMSTKRGPAKDPLSRKSKKRSKKT